ncbi:MAG: pilus assembly PilX N-terminal domain-containing protein [Patescibacteria group bacterium]|nr:pilus assembly PilX N-terminal domain-containing protein [Patescibacteria group bacterium]
MKFSIFNFQFSKGVSLYLTIVILAVLTSTLLVMVNISVSQIKVILTLSDSVLAFYAADSGVEKALYGVYTGSYTPVLGECPPNFQGTLENGASYKVCVSGTSTSTIFSTGSFKETKRKIEVNFYTL